MTATTDCRSTAARLSTDVQTTHLSIYLITGASGVKLSEHAVLSSPTCDVILLCYAEPCANSWPGGTNDDRLEFAYYPKSTWTEARNRLYALARQREARLGRTYLYYTFLDGDFIPALDLGRPAAQALNDSTPRAAWRLYEQLLMQYLPAIATPRATPTSSSVPFGLEDVTVTEVHTRDPSAGPE